MRDLWNSYSTSKKIAFVLCIFVFAFCGWSITASYVLSLGLKLPYNISDDWNLWFEYIFQTNLGEKTKRWISISGFIGILPCLLFVGLLIKKNIHPNPHGDAKFANNKSIAAMGMRSDRGFICGFTGALPSKHYGFKTDKYGKKIPEGTDGGAIKIAKSGHLNKLNTLVFGGPEHITVYAPTRGGKGVSIVIPNLLNWDSSAVVLDIKSENYNLTSGFRKESGQEVFRFSPGDENYESHRWNPLSVVRRGTSHQIEDLQRIAAIFIPLEAKDPFFDLSARNAFVGIGGYLAETPDLPFTLAEIYRQLVGQEDTVKHLKDIIKTREADGNPLSPQTSMILRDFITKSSGTFESVKSTITARLGIYVSPTLERATSESDFDFSDLRKKRQTVYVCVTPKDIERLSPLINLFFQSCVEANMGQLPEQNSELKHKILFCMDEFAALGKLSSFKNGISYFAGYGIKLLTILQSPAQLYDIYGKDAAEVFLENSGVEIVFTPNRLERAEELSKRIGYISISTQSETRSKIITDRKSGSYNQSLQQRALFLPQELLLLSQQEQLVFIGGQLPIKANKIRFYAEQSFLDRASYKPAFVPNNKPKISQEAFDRMYVDQQKLSGVVANLEKRLMASNALKSIMEENAAKGEDIVVEMSKEEIINPEKISLSRIDAAAPDARVAIEKLKEENRIATAEGQRIILEANDIHVPEK